MYDKLGEVILKTGERMEVGVITMPDEHYAEEVERFLGHKIGDLRWYIELCLDEALDGLENRFYVGKLDGRVITNISTIEYEGIGILMNVWTMPQKRRKGASKGIMAYQMEDFRQRTGQSLYLGTEYDGVPYYIYRSFGFEALFPESGYMKYHVASDFEERYFAPAPVRPKSVEWSDWPRCAALSAIIGGDVLRSLTWGVYGPRNLEGGFLSYKRALETDDIYDDAKLLVTFGGAIVGWATVVRDERWSPATAVLDLFFHPNFVNDIHTLLSAIVFPESKIQCYVDSGSKKKAAILETIGFTCEGRFKNQFAYGGQHYDVLVYARG